MVPSGVDIDPRTYRPGPATRREQEQLVALQRVELEENLKKLDKALEKIAAAPRRGEDDPLEQLTPSAFARGVLGGAPRSEQRPLTDLFAGEDDDYASAIARGARLREPVSSRAPASYARAGLRADGSALRPDLEQAVQVELNTKPRPLPPPVATGSVPATWRAGARGLQEYGITPELREDYYPGSAVPSLAPVTERSPSRPSSLALAESSRDLTVRSARVEVPEDVADTERTPSPSRPYKDVKLDCTRAMLEDALRATGGNKRQAAIRLGMDHSGFYKALRRTGLPTTGL